MNATTTQQQLSDEVDKGLLDIVKNGTPCVGPDGTILTDSEGNVVKRHAPAAYFAVALKRLQMCNVSAAPVEGSPIANVAEIIRREAAKQQLKLTCEIPELDEDGRDAATG